jgi:hypothetical protein
MAEMTANATDSNILIYAAQKENQFLREFIAGKHISISAITQLEVLGYHKLKPQDAELFQLWFDNAHIITIDRTIIKRAITLR